MMTGEGKTLAAVAPAYLNALAGKGAHVVTVNEYLARRDAVWMGQIYRALGLTVASIVPNAAYLYDPNGRLRKKPTRRPRTKEARHRRAVFWSSRNSCVPCRGARRIGRTSPTARTTSSALIIFATTWSTGLEDRVQREHYFAIIDEVDSILIDEARTPLIIAAPDAASSDFL